MGTPQSKEEEAKEDPSEGGTVASDQGAAVVHTDVTVISGFSNVSDLSEGPSRVQKSSNVSDLSRGSRPLGVQKSSKPRRHLKKKKRKEDTFAIHGVALESVDLGRSLPILIGSMMEPLQNRRDHRRDHTPSVSSKCSSADNSRTSVVKETIPEDEVMQDQPLPPPQALHATSMVAPVSTADYEEMLSRALNRDAECLPPPVHEAEMKFAEYLKQRAAASSPLQVNPTNRAPQAARNPISSQSAGDTEYLERVYDHRTWNMYKLITETREKQETPYIPQAPSPDGHHDLSQSALDMLESEASPSHHMAFAIDMD